MNETKREAMAVVERARWREQARTRAGRMALLRECRESLDRMIANVEDCIRVVRARTHGGRAMWTN